MSGPKAYSYSIPVETAEQRETRELRSARAAEAAAEAKWFLVQARITAERQAFGDTITAPTVLPAAQTTAAAVRTRAQAVTAITADAAARLEQERDTHARQAMRAHLDFLVADLGDDLFAVPTAKTTPGRSTEQSRFAPDPTITDTPATAITSKTRDAVRSLLHRLPGDTLDGAQRRAGELADQILTSTNSSRLEGLFGLLRQLVTSEINRVELAAAAVEAHMQTAADLAALRSELDLIPLPVAATLRATIDELAATHATQIPPTLPEKIREALQAHTAEQNRRYVAQTLLAGLTQLGYSVGPDFDTDLHSRGVAYARTDDSYGVKIRFEPDSEHFTAQVVAHDAKRHSDAEDFSAQDQFCGKMGQLAKYVGAHGVVAHLETDNPAGTVAVQQVSAQRMPQVRRHRQQQRQRFA